MELHSYHEDDSEELTEEVIHSYPQENPPSKSKINEIYKKIEDLLPRDFS